MTELSSGNAILEGERGDIVPIKHENLTRWIDMPNIADELDDVTLSAIGQRVKREYDIDVRSRSEWLERTKEALNLAMQIAQEKTYPWPKAANVIYPLMTSAAMQFAARAYPAIVNGRNIVKGVVIGDDSGVTVPGPDGQPQQITPPGMKRVRANRVGEHMSWQLLDEMPEWEEDTDTLLHVLPIAGCMFRKSYFDPTRGRNMSCTVSPLYVVINYRAKSVELAPRVTEEISFYPLEIIEMERFGLFKAIRYTSSPNTDGDTDAAQQFLEQHRWWDLDEDGYPEPYIITVHKDTAQVVRIRARYEADGVMFSRDGQVKKIVPLQYYTKYDFLPNLEGGIYGLGFGQLLKPINEAVNTSLNQLIDAGHLANTGGGFIGKGLSMSTGAVRFSPGEYKMVNVAGSVVKDNIVPLQFPGPSMVLFQLLGLMIDAGKDIAAVKDVLTGDQQQHNVPATTTLALIEQGLKVFTGIYKRVHRSLKEELNKLYRLNSIYLPQETMYRKGDDWKSISQDDYKQGNGVEPVSDPTMVSDLQKLGQAQFLMQFGQDPMFNQMELRRRILDAASIEHVEMLLQPPPPPPQLVIKGMELDIKAAREKAAELKDLAQAILFFAQADQAVGGMHLQYVQAQLEAWKAQFEAANAPNQTAPGQAGPSPMSGPALPPPGPSPVAPGAGPQIPTPPGAPGQGDIAGNVHLSVARTPPVGATQ